MAKPPAGISREDFVRCVDHVIRERKTRKVLDGPCLPREEGDAAKGGGANGAQGSAAAAARARFDTALHEALRLAGWAPFHYARDEALPEPWRFSVLDREALDAILENAGDLLLGKLPRIFAAAGALVQVTWVPEEDPERRERDWEHAAAAAAATQNLILALEARGLGTYWSSAAPLASELMAAICGIPPQERYLGSVFVGCPLDDEREAAEGWSGKMRPRRTAPEAGWVRVVRPRFAE